MEPTIGIPITFTVFQELCKFLDGSTVSEEVATVASKAISAWIEQQSAPPKEDSPALLGGYQWKHVFLPEGTKLRVVVKRKTFHAAVVGDQIMFDGQATSPACMVNQLASTTRNAWKHIWILLPGQSIWQLAQSMRE
ncbi:hypothetical protein SAMN05518865_109168 [Duganella sp. CF458]|uniref:hypothetical protein n=1 Tax=Duganella sp. CF458 TaxID=1884368 RepID=UPI0008E70C51|nr:hypothetical protein [Duganella sp. CF458]SFG20122.1 hypothetical protein SAMN05518865_109168 [Duganella sp. CF458]